MFCICSNYRACNIPIHFNVSGIFMLRPSMDTSVGWLVIVGGLTASLRQYFVYIGVVGLGNGAG